MTLHNKIQDWFRRGGSFIEGTTLLMQTGANTARFQRYFSASFVPGNVDAELKAALAAIVRDAPPSPLKGEQAPPAKEPVQENRSVPPFRGSGGQKSAEEPEQILTLRRQARKLHKRQSHVHALLSAATSDEDRLDHAKEIMTEIIPSLDAKYDAIRAWQETGDLPSTAAVVDDFKRGVEAMKRHNSLKSRISRLKSHLKGFKISIQERQRYEQELADKELEILEIEKEIEG